MTLISKDGAPDINTPILLSHDPEKAFDMLLERLREPWEKMNGVAAKKIDRILVDRREADAAIVMLRKDLATARARCVALHTALTPSAETKAAYIGEVKFTVSTGFGDDGCEVWQDITVPWTTTKDIMAMISGHAAMQSHPAYAQPAPPQPTGAKTDVAAPVEGGER